MGNDDGVVTLDVGGRLFRTMWVTLCSGRAVSDPCVEERVGPSRSTGNAGRSSGRRESRQRSGSQEPEDGGSNYFTGLRDFASSTAESTGSGQPQRSESTLEIDRCPDRFSVILNYLRYGRFPPVATVEYSGPASCSPPAGSVYVDPIPTSQTSSSHDVVVVGTSLTPSDIVDEMVYYGIPVPHCSFTLRPLSRREVVDALSGPIYDALCAVRSRMTEERSTITLVTAPATSVCAAMATKIGTSLPSSLRMKIPLALQSCLPIPEPEHRTFLDLRAKHRLEPIFSTFLDMFWCGSKGHVDYAVIQLDPDSEVVFAPSRGSADRMSPAALQVVRFHVAQLE